MARRRTKDARGDRGRLLGVSLGDLLLWEGRPVTGAMTKLTCLWEEGVFLGVKATSGEYIEYMVAYQKGVVKTRTTAIKQAEERWAPKVLDMFGGVLPR